MEETYICENPVLENCVIESDLPNVVLGQRFVKHCPREWNARMYPNANIHFSLYGHHTGSGWGNRLAGAMALLRWLAENTHNGMGRWLLTWDYAPGADCMWRVEDRDRAEVWLGPDVLNILLEIICELYDPTPDDIELDNVWPLAEDEVIEELPIWMTNAGEEIIEFADLDDVRNCR